AALVARHLHSFPTRRSSDLERLRRNGIGTLASAAIGLTSLVAAYAITPGGAATLLRNVLETSLVVAIAATVFVLYVGRESRKARSEEHTSELQSQSNLVCRL